ncbi:MAG: hypothetical protein ACM3N5_01065 [Candidatus Eiseniibacteriota bacterium]
MLAAGACLIATFVALLNYNDYPLARPEVAIGIGILCLVAVLLGLACARLNERERTLFWALFLAIIMQMNFDGGALVVLATAAVAYLLKNRAIAVGGIVFFVVLMFQAAQAVVTSPGAVPSPALAQAASRPVIVHVILDEAIGIEGMPTDVPEAAEAAAWGRDKLVADGFVVFGRAFAQHMHTINSVPLILSLGGNNHGEQSGIYYRLDDAAYLAALDARGFAVKAYENQYARYCGSAAVDACVLAPSYRALAASSLTSGEKAIALLHAFVSLSDPLAILLREYDTAVAAVPGVAEIMPRLDWSYGNVPPAFGGKAVLDQLIADVAAARPGQAYFAHVLLPHHPHVFDAACHVKPEAEWTNRVSSVRSRRELYSSYANQWRCAVSRIDALVRRLEAARPNNDFVVIVHGDHGARIAPVDPDTDNIETLPHRTVREFYSTLVAIRLPGQPGGYRTEQVTAAAVLRSAVAANFRGPLEVESTAEPAVFLVEPDSWEPVRSVAVPWLFDRTKD